MKSSIYYQKCEFMWLVKRINNRCTLTLHDRSCKWNYGKIVVLSKEKLKNLFNKKRVSNLLYLEGLEILKGLRKRKSNE